MPPDPENGASRFALADLEFDQVRRLLEVRTRTPMGSEQAAALLPSPDAQEVATRLQLLREGLQLAEEGLSLHFPPLAHPRPELRQLQVAGAVIEGAGLRNLAALAVAVHDMVRELAPHRAAVPAITALLEQVGDLAPFARACRGVFAADGGLNDEASPHLRSLRRRIQQCAERVRRKMAAYLEGPDAERYLRDEFVTQRNGRFVLPVRSEKRKAVGGIVHGASASGITLYVEPLAMVELNNDLIRLQEEETAEEARILAELSHLARDLREAFAMATQVVGRLDQLSAAVALATEFDCRPAMLNEEPKIELVAARHLLLAARLAGSGQDVVPATLSLDHGAPVLIISGPNTGGKTVALKTLGLAVLMNQAGLPVPAHRAALPVFRQVLADIGDHQSLDQDLSTFSSHIQALVRMTGDTVQPALVLVDELGTGTDPEEGAALGIAVVEHFRQRGGFVMVTTHHNGLKAYAETTPGVRNASVEFDEDSLRPTYRLLHGVAGRSGGLDIAERLGLAPAIVKHARSLISDTGRLTQQYVARLADLAGAAADHRLQAEEDRRLAAAERQKAEDDRARLQASHAGELAAAVEAARRNLEKAGREVLNRIEQEFGRQRRLKAEEKARSEYSRLARRESSGVGGGTRTVAGGRPAHRPLVTGDRVRLAGMGGEGIVASVESDGRVTVQVGHARLISSQEQLQLIGSVEAEASSSLPPRQGSSGDAEPVDPGHELHLRGYLVEDALRELDQYLDRALLAGHGQVRVIHGHGSGRLKKAVRAHLNNHPAVSGYRPGGSGEGGDGVTMAILSQG